MDPFNALSIATGIITFVDFGAKLVSLYREVRRSDDGRPQALSALKAESLELSSNASQARENVASLQERYPRQSESLARLATECTQVEKELQGLTDFLTVKAGHGLRTRGAQAVVSVRGVLKQGDFEGLQDRLRSIREQTMMSVIMCILEDVTETRVTLNGVDGGVNKLLDILRPLQRTVNDLQPEFHNISRNRPLATEVQRARIAGGLWTSIITAHQADSQAAPGSVEEPLDHGRGIYNRILKSLELEDMRTRESQIENSFPDTFQWLLEDESAESDKSSARSPTKFKQWLESPTNEAPYWITGKPASGKSTLMKLICNDNRIQTHLRVWSGEFQLLTCSVYFWNPGSLGQKGQIGLLHTILYQLLCQRPDLCRHVAPKRYIYFQLAGMDSPDPLDWTLEELRDCIIRFLTRVDGTSRVAMFVDGLDEYEGNHEELVSFLKQLHEKYNIKLCISSRPWNIFRDMFRSYPSLRMEFFTKPDIEKYVYTRIGNSLAFQELRALDFISVQRLESQIVEKAEGVFLWVVLVTENLLTIARENNDLDKIWKVFEDLPNGLEELYGSIRRRLDQSHRESASRMYQLLFRWSSVFIRPFGILEFWMATNCHNPINLPRSLTEEEVPRLLPVIERRLAGTTGGILQVVRESAEQTISVGFLHRTVFDWLQSIKSLIIDDGPTEYDPSLVLTSVLVSRLNFVGLKEGHAAADVDELFTVGQSCNDSAESRAKLLVIIDQLQMAKSILKEDYFDLAIDSSIISSLSDSVTRSLLATRHLFSTYLQAKLESDSGTTGLELPRHLHLVPEMLWNKSQRLPSRVADWLIRYGEGFDDDPVVPNMILKTFAILVQAQFIPRRALRAKIKKTEHRLPKELWQALLDVVAGKGFKEFPVTGTA
ncbi:hypothetical protein QBC40DRAFT_64335 [Triangularia verruculosa]|uniref:Nephrocystin 3-like N-terminal domain-containing protein n=1 Tax=Triangularia verruculosa TaxID=2587418 RepID=A0AAN6XNJ9_9PEZI|nr:hypothetical protein QBC40DRAFT_64335 [Triangularia verruculosa]